MHFFKTYIIKKSPWLTWTTLPILARLSIQTSRPSNKQPLQAKSRQNMCGWYFLAFSESVVLRLQRSFYNNHCTQLHFIGISSVVAVIPNKFWWNTANVITRNNGIFLYMTINTFIVDCTARKKERKKEKISFYILLWKTDKVLWNSEATQLEP